MDGLSLRDLLFRGVIMTGFWLVRFLPTLDRSEIAKFPKEVMDLLEQGIFKPRAGEAMVPLSSNFIHEDNLTY